MHWTQRHVPIDGPTAAVIAAGMRAVARADGDVHPRELELIQAFEADLPGSSVPDARAVLVNADLHDAYARSLVMVALADGVITESEDRVIRELCGALGVEDEQLDTIIGEVKRWFLSRFAGVTVFRDAVERIAADLGLDAPAPDGGR